MKKILLIDDSDTYIWNLRKYLQRRGYPVKTASTLEEARAVIQEEMPLVVCCNLELPDGTAMELFHTLRRVAGMFQMKNPPVRLLRSLSSLRTTTLPRNMNTGMRA